MVLITSPLDYVAAYCYFIQCKLWIINYGTVHQVQSPALYRNFSPSFFFYNPFEASYYPKHIQDSQVLHLLYKTVTFSQQATLNTDFWASFVQSSHVFGRKTGIVAGMVLCCHHKRTE